MSASPLGARYAQWIFVRSAVARGWWLVTAVYLVVDARLSPVQLVLIGTAQGVTVLLAEVPAGIMADTVSRRRSLVLAHFASGTGMLLTGLVTEYPLIVLSQCLWGLGWAFFSGADTAWITDELDRPDLIDRVLTRGARSGLVGAGVGTLVFGAIATLTALSAAIVLAGALMIAIGVVLVARFPEKNFVPVPRARAGAVQVLRGSVRIARRDKAVLAILVATLLVNAAGEGYGRLLERRLIDLGIPQRPSPMLWFTILSLACLASGALMLRLVERRIDAPGEARRTYIASCLVSAIGMLLFAHANGPLMGVATVFVINGIAGPVARPVSDIWINRRTPSAVRATVHSLNSQMENLGEVLFGFSLALIAGAFSATGALTVSVALTALAAAVVSRSDDRLIRPVPS